MLRLQIIFCNLKCNFFCFELFLWRLDQSSDSEIIKTKMCSQFFSIIRKTVEKFEQMILSKYQLDEMSHQKSRIFICVYINRSNHLGLNRAHRYKK